MKSNNLTNQVSQFSPHKSPKSNRIQTFSGSTNITTLNTSIPILQQQLRILKQQQKKYNKLVNKLKQIQKQFQQISKKQQSEQFITQNQTDQIENLKKEIEDCIKDTKRIENQTAQINKQIEQSNKQLNSLQVMLNNLRQQNKQKRNIIKQKGLIYQQKQKQLQQIQQQRDHCQIDIETLKLQVEKLVHEEYRLKKQAQIVQFKQQQQEKAAKKLQQMGEKLRVQKIQIQSKVGCISQIFKNEQEKYRNIKQELNLLNIEQNELLQQFRRKQNLSKQNKHKIMSGRAKIQSLLQQIQTTDHDLKLLTSQYSKETDRLRDLQIKNSQLNQNLDQTCRDAHQIWDNLIQTLDIAANNQDIWSLDSLMKIRSQALQIWNQIQSIVQ